MAVHDLARCTAGCLVELLAVRVLRYRRGLLCSTEILSVEDWVSAKCHCGCPPEKGLVIVHGTNYHARVAGKVPLFTETKLNRDKKLEDCHPQNV